MLDQVVKFQTVLLRDDVEVDTVAVDPEEVKFGRIELMPEEEKEESRERALGLIEAPEAERPRPPSDSEFGKKCPKIWTRIGRRRRATLPKQSRPRAEAEEEKS